MEDSFGLLPIIDMNKKKLHINAVMYDFFLFFDKMPAARGEDENPRGGAGWGEDKNPRGGPGRGGAKKRINQLIWKFDKSA